MCIHHIFGCLVGGEAGCNWYLRDINIFPLSKKCEEKLLDLDLESLVDLLFFLTSPIPITFVALCGIENGWI